MSQPTPYLEWLQSVDASVRIIVTIEDEVAATTEVLLSPTRNTISTDAAIEALGKIERHQIPAKLDELYQEFTEESENG